MTSTNTRKMGVIEHILKNPIKLVIIIAELLFQRNVIGSLSMLRELSVNCKMAKVICVLVAPASVLIIQYINIITSRYNVPGQNG